MKLRVLNPSAGVPRNVAALVSAAIIDANTAHHGIDRPPSANSVRFLFRRPAQSPIPTIPEKYNTRTAASIPSFSGCMERGGDHDRGQRATVATGAGARFLTTIREFLPL